MMYVTKRMRVLQLACALSHSFGALPLQSNRFKVQTKQEVLVLVLQLQEAEVRL